jgi:RNA polymerase sigma factor (sigma-70 family)
LQHAKLFFTLVATHMDDLPDLKSLVDQDSGAWQRLFDALFPVALGIVKWKLGSQLPHMVEDVAAEALSELVGKVGTVSKSESLRPLLVQIAKNKAVDELRRHYSLKGGAGRIDSIEGNAEDGALKLPSVESPEEELRFKELVALTAGLMEAVEPKKRALLVDFFLHEKKQSEISTKHSIPIGSIGVYLKRGLESLRKELDRRPRLAGEFRTVLGLPARAFNLLLCLV